MQRLRGQEWKISCRIFKRLYMKNGTYIWNKHITYKKNENYFFCKKKFREVKGEKFFKSLGFFLKILNIASLKKKVNET